jgi:hypothetical protein
MKATFKRGLCGMSGKMDGAIYYYNSALKRTIMRSYTKPASNPGAELMKLIMANLKLINPAQDFIQNFRDYLLLYNKLPANQNQPAVTWMNLYLKMLFAMAKANPTIDLTTLSRQQIYAEDLPCKCLKTAIDAGLLPSVRNYNRFIALI